jgi:anti-sigma28 factor (negative regulator of flagellin synthesis)
MRISGMDMLSRLVQPWRAAQNDSADIRVGTAPQRSTVGDRVEISGIAEALSREHAATNDRSARIAEIRRQIQAGTYNVDDEAKFAVIADRLLKDIASSS